MKDHLTPKQVSRAIGVSESSLKRWCDRGLITMVKTAGGHRRLPLHGVLAFLRENDYPLVDPTALGLPATSGQGEWVTNRARDLLQEALVDGRLEEARQIIFDQYLAGRSISEICDDLIAESLNAIGDLWECGSVDVYQERRGCQHVHQLLMELRMALPNSRPDAPVAFGATLEGDHYSVPISMVELVLRDRGWDATALGSNIPAESLVKSITSARPALFWVSASFIKDADRFVTDYKMVQEAAGETGTALVVGGRAFTEPIRKQLRYAAFCDTLAQLEQFADSIDTRPPGDVRSERVSRNGSVSSNGQSS